jgi:hypothetical protein
MHKALLTTLLLLSVLQVFFVNPLAAQSDMESGWSDNLSISAGLDWTKGDTDMINYSYNFSYEASYTNEWDLSLTINGSYGETEGVMSTNQHMMQLTFDRWFWRGTFSANYLGEIETNKMSNVFTRTTTGIGLKFRPLRRWWVEFSLWTIPVIVHDRQYDTLETEAIMRERNGVTLIFYFSEDQSNSLKFEYYYQPALDDYSNYMSMFKADLTVYIVGNVNLTVSFVNKYVSRPLESKYFESEYQVLKKTNYSTNVSVGISL